MTTALLDPAEATVPDLIPLLDTKLCDCAGCGTEILGESMPTDRRRLAKVFVNTPRVHARVNGRPYCRSCIQSSA